MAANTHRLAQNVSAGWPFVLALLLLPGWYLARTSFIDVRQELDFGIGASMVFLVTVGLFVILGKAGTSIRETRTKVLIHGGTRGELAVLQTREGRQILVGEGDVAQKSVAESARRMKVLAGNHGVPRLVRLRERAGSAEATVELGEVYPLTPATLGGIEEVRTVVSSLLDVLAACHARGFVLGDLPSNTVFVRRGGAVVLLLLSPPTTGACSQRASPEVARGETPEARDDVYAVCALIYELVTRVPLLAEGQDPETVLAKLPALEPSLRRTILRGLGPRDQRFAKLADLRAALDELPWRAGFLASLIERVRAVRNDSRYDHLERRRSVLFMEQVVSREVGAFSVTLRSANLLDLAFDAGDQGAGDRGAQDRAARLEGSFVESASGAVLGTVVSGRASIALASLDVDELARGGIVLRTPSGSLHDLTDAVPAPPEDGAAQAARMAARGREGWLALLRGRTALALRLLAVDTLLAVLEVPDAQGGPPADVRRRVEDEVARRLLLRSHHPLPGSTAWNALDQMLPPDDVARAVLAELATAAENASLEARARRHEGALQKLAATPGRLSGVAREALGGIPRDGHAVCVLGGLDTGVGLVRAQAAWLRISPESIVDSAKLAARREDGSPAPRLAVALERATELASGLLGLEGSPRVTIPEALSSVRLAVVPLFVATVLARTDRLALPRQVTIAAGLDQNGRIERLGAELERVVDAALAAGMRLLLVPREDVEEARGVRGACGAETRDLVIDGLPDVPLPELVRFVEQRVMEHFPSQLELDAAHSRRVLERARSHMADARPQRALDALGFLQRTLVQAPADVAFSNLRAICLAETAACRHAIGQWRLALEAFQQAGAELETLRDSRRLDWSGIELLYELPNRKAACLLQAFAFDVAGEALRESVAAKTALPLISNHSLAKSHGILGQLNLEHGLASGPGEPRAERFKLARSHLAQALEKIDLEERPKNLNFFGHLEAYSGNFDEARRCYDEVEAIESKATRVDRRIRNAEVASFGRVLLEMQRGLHGEKDAFSAVEELGEELLAQESIPAALRARTARLVGSALIEAGEPARARPKLVASRELWSRLEAGGVLPAILPDVELARLDAIAGRPEEATSRIADALARLEQFRKQVLGLSKFAVEYATELARGLQAARESLEDADRAGALLGEVRERVPY
jgi:hypothetical protein